MKKNQILRAVLLVLIFVSIKYKTSGQNLILIIKDEATGSRAEFAAVSVHSAKDSTIITSALTDTMGNVKFKMPLDCFYLKCEMISYEKYSSKKYCPEEVTQPITLFLKPAGKELNELVIEGQKSLFKMQGEKKVFDVSNSIASLGGTATQVLQQVPVVNVDIDGNISVRGNSNVLVLINGQQSGLTGASRQAILDQIPANNIDRIEVITNPSARYDADGMSGIINIILKENTEKGINGAVTLGVGSNHKYNGNVNLSIKEKNISYNLNYAYRYNQMYMYGNSERNNFFADTSFSILQNTNSLSKPHNHNLRLSTDFNYWKKTSLNVSLNGGVQTKAENEIIQYFNYSPNDVFRNAWYRDAITKSRNNNAELAFALRHNFSKKGEELSIAGNSSYNESFSEAFFENIPLNNLGSDFYLLQRNPITTLLRVAVIQTDYTKPLHNNLKFDAGLKYAYRNISTDFVMENANESSGIFVSPLFQNNQFRYYEAISAAYLILQKSDQKYNWQTGIRAEHTALKIVQLANDSTVPRNYLSLFPNANFNYIIDKKNEIQFAVSRRLNRPSPQNLNPFSDFSDPFNIRTGNPYLNPEFIYAGELTYQNKNVLGTFVTTGYYRRINNTMQRFRNVFPDGTSVVEFRNFAYASNSGVELIWRADPAKIFNFTINGNLYYTTVKGSQAEGDLANDNFNYNVKLISALKIPNIMEVQITGMYNARNVLLQGFFGPIYGLDIALRRDFWKKSASLAINITDIFDTKIFNVYQTGANFESNIYRKRETRILMINFTYKIGKPELSKKRQQRQQESGPDFNDMGGF